MEKYELYQEAKSKTLQANKWLALADAKDSQDGKFFRLSLAHSTFMLKRCGQHSEGSENYWESPDEFNNKMLEVIQIHYDHLTAEAVGLLKESERLALVALKADVDELSVEIEGAMQLDNKQE